MTEEIDINKLKKSMLEEDTIIDIAELFKVFADSTRVKIINAKLVKYTKVGKTVYYELSDDHVKTLFNMGKEHINEI